MDNSQDLTSVIIVNYNTGDILKQCVESLFMYEKNVEVIIVDNNSPDDSGIIIESLAAKHSNIVPVMLKNKTGFSDANNKGFDLSSGKFLLIMNPDIIFKESVISKMKRALESENISACGPLLIGSDGEFQRRYFQRYPTVRQFIFFYSILSKLFMNSRYLINKFLYNCDINTGSAGLEFTEQIPCAFFMTTREHFINAGKMDADYPLFFEDVDLSFKMNKAGRLAVDTTAKVTHLGGSSFKKEDDYWLYGRFIIGMLIFFKKHYSSFRYLLLKFIARLNSRIILLTEYLFHPGKFRTRYRYRKHKFFLDESKQLQ